MTCNPSCSQSETCGWSLCAQGPGLWAPPNCLMEPGQLPLSWYVTVLDLSRCRTEIEVQSLCVLVGALDFLFMHGFLCAHAVLLPIQLRQVCWSSYLASDGIRFEKENKKKSTFSDTDINMTRGKKKPSSLFPQDISLDCEVCGNIGRSDSKFPEARARASTGFSLI